MANTARLARANPDALPAGAEAAGRSTAATEAVLALAQKLHDKYVSEGQDTCEQLISEGQSHRDRVVGEATLRQQELLATGQARYDALLSAGQARQDALIAEANAQVAKATSEHERLITEARQLSTGMVAEAEQRRAEVLDGLSVQRRFLKKEIDELRRSEHDQRARLKSYLQARLVELEQNNNDGTG